MTENIIVGVVIVIALAWAGRSLYRAFSGTAGPCACGKGDGCNSPADQQKVDLTVSIRKTQP